MPEVSAELFLEHMRSLRERLDKVDEGQRLMRDEMIAMKKLVGALVQQDLNRDDEMAHVRKRLDRIEARLELVE